VNEDIQKLVGYRMGQAAETLAAAKQLAEAGHCRDAANRAYYAMFYCGLALLAARGLGASKHSGVLSLFSHHFVKTGDFSVECGRHLREAFELRQACDYREFLEITRDQADEVVTNAEAFIREAWQTLSRMGCPGQ